MSTPATSGQLRFEQYDDGSVCVILETDHWCELYGAPCTWYVVRVHNDQWPRYGCTPAAEAGEAEEYHWHVCQHSPTKITRERTILNAVLAACLAVAEDQ